MVVSFGQHTELFSRRTWSALIAFAILSTGFAASGQSLVQLTEQAQGHDAAWRSARAQLDASISQGAQAKAGLLPQIGMQAGAQYSDSRSRFEMAGIAGQSNLAAPQYSAAIQATQPLYNPSNYATYQQGQRSVTLAYAQLESASQAVLMRTAQAYFKVLSAQDTLRLVQAQKLAVAEQLEFAQRNFEIGTATITDAREAQARFDLVRANEIAVSNELAVSQHALDQLVGQDQATPWGLAKDALLPSLAPSDFESWITIAEETHPAIRQAQVAVEIARLEIDKAQAGHLPTVDLQASYGAQRNPEGMASAAAGMSHMRSHVGTVGVVVNIPLFAGFALQNRVRETLSLEEKAAADLEDVRRQVHQSVRSAVLGVQSAASQVQALEAAVLSSQSALEANKMGYEVGVRINMDVLNAQSQLFQSQKDLSAARYQLLLGHLQLHQAAGNLSMQDVHAINALLAPLSDSLADQINR